MNKRKRDMLLSKIILDITLPMSNFRKFVDKNNHLERNPNQLNNKNLHQREEIIFLIIIENHIIILAQLIIMIMIISQQE